MSPANRREFLRRSAIALPVLGGFLPSWAGAATDERAEKTLAAVAEVVLPARTLGPEAFSDVLWRFAKWSDAFQPVAELDHPYLSTDEISYGPADPRPLWRAQLEGLELEAQKRHASSFAALDGELRRALIESQLPRGTGGRLPHASEAPHIGIALMSWFFATTEANDLCHGARIGRHTCRGLPDAVHEPETLDGVPDWREERQ